MICLVMNGDPIMSMVQLDYVLVYLGSVLLNCCGSTDFSKVTYPPPTLVGMFKLWQISKSYGYFAVGV